MENQNKIEFADLKQANQHKLGSAVQYSLTAPHKLDGATGPVMQSASHQVLHIGRFSPENMYDICRAACMQRFSVVHACWAWV